MCLQHFFSSQSQRREAGPSPAFAAPRQAPGEGAPSRALRRRPGNRCVRAGEGEGAFPGPEPAGSGESHGRRLQGRLEAASDLPRPSGHVGAGPVPPLPERRVSWARAWGFREGSAVSAGNSPRLPSSWPAQPRPRSPARPFPAQEEAGRLLPPLRAGRAPSRLGLGREAPPRGKRRLRSQHVPASEAEPPGAGAAAPEGRPPGLGGDAGPGQGRGGEDVPFPPGGQVMGDSSDVWVGSAYLFVQSTSEKVFLPVLYENPQKKPSVFKALKLALADSTGSLNGVDMLKVHCSDPHLIIQLKFCKQENCRKFLRSYRQGALQESLQKHLKVSLAMSNAVLVQMELKAGTEKLDSMIREEERCLDCIYHEKPNRLRDEEITELEESLRSLNCYQESSPGSKHPSCNSLPPSSSSLQISNTVDTFTFQGQQFANRRITPDDHQKFAKLVSKKWKQVGRSLQSTCRALRDPVIDNLAIEYDREGLYEQAYQLLRKFIDSEGKKATLQRLVAALEENGLISLAEELVGLSQNENRL